MTARGEEIHWSEWIEGEWGVPDQGWRKNKNNLGRDKVSAPNLLIPPPGAASPFASPSPAQELAPAALAPCSSLANLSFTQDQGKSAQMKVGRTQLLVDY